MAKSILIESGDIIFKDNRLQLVADNQQIVQKINGLLKTRYGELFYNAEIGLKREEILSITEKFIDKERQKIAIIEALSQLSEIKTINSVDINKQGRKTYIEFTCTLQDETDITGGVEIG